METFAIILALVLSLVSMYQVGLLKIDFNSFQKDVDTAFEDVYAEIGSLRSGKEKPSSSILDDPQIKEMINFTMNIIKNLGEDEGDVSKVQHKLIEDLQKSNEQSGKTVNNLLDKINEKNSLLSACLHYLERTSEMSDSQLVKNIKESLS